MGSQCELASVSAVARCCNEWPAKEEAVLGLDLCAKHEPIEALLTQSADDWSVLCNLFCKVTRKRNRSVTL